MSFFLFAPQERPRLNGRAFPREEAATWALVPRVGVPDRGPSASAPRSAHRPVGRAAGWPPRGQVCPLPHWSSRKGEATCWQVV